MTPATAHRPARSAAQQRALKLFVVLLRAADAANRRSLRKMAQHGLTPTEFSILEVLYHKGQLLLGEVQRKILLTSGGVTYTVDRLVEKGYVQRRECEFDRRARYAALTPKGEALMRRIFPEHARDIEDAMSALTAAEQEQATGLLRTLGKAADAS